MGKTVEYNKLGEKNRDITAAYYLHLQYKSLPISPAGDFQSVPANPLS